MLEDGKYRIIGYYSPGSVFQALNGAIVPLYRDSEVYATIWWQVSGEDSISTSAGDYPLSSSKVNGLLEQLTRLGYQYEEGDIDVNGAADPELTVEETIALL